WSDPTRPRSRTPLNGSQPTIVRRARVPTRPRIPPRPRNTPLSPSLRRHRSVPGCGRGSRPGSGVPDGRHRGRWARIWPYLALFVLAVGLRVFAPGPIDVTIDEPNWLIRSRQFAHAVVHLDPSGAT